MGKKKTKYYVVWEGKTPGIYTTWADCEAQVKGVSARYMGFETEAEAQKAFADDWHVYIKPATRKAAAPQTATAPVFPALAVDAACSGNPGVMEFRGVIADTGTEVFHRGPYKGGTNNIGEFLAIVLGLAYLKKHNLDWRLYSDSRTGLAWLRKGHADTKIEWNADNLPLLEMIRSAEKWIHENTWTTEIHKWDTEHWGEIPADFGRK